jgi:hypothetical protein
MKTTSEAGLGVDGEHDAGGAEVGAHHALHAGRQRHVRMGEALVHAVADGPVVVEGGEHLLHLVQDVVDADHVQEGLLLARERGVGQVFGGGRRAHGEAGLRIAGLQLFEGGADLALQVGGKGCASSQPRISAPAAASARTSSVSSVCRRCWMRAARPACFEEFAEGVGRGGEAGGDAHALGSWEIISPRLAFLPPTASTSVILRFSNGTTRAVALKRADMGNSRSSSVQALHCPQAFGVHR